MTSDVSKAAKHLPEDRLVVLEVTPGYVDALVPTGYDWHSVRWTVDTGWTCTCPARTTACGHLLAVRSIVAPRPDDAEQSAGG
jgi:uncharacterized Zn finger protein